MTHRTLSFYIRRPCRMWIQSIQRISRFWIVDAAQYAFQNTQIFRFMYTNRTHTTNNNHNWWDHRNLPANDSSFSSSDAIGNFLRIYTHTGSSGSNSNNRMYPLAVAKEWICDVCREKKNIWEIPPELERLFQLATKIGGFPQCIQSQFQLKDTNFDVLHEWIFILDFVFEIFFFSLSLSQISMEILSHTNSRQRFDCVTQDFFRKHAFIYWINVQYTATKSQMIEEREKRKKKKKYKMAINSTSMG